MDTASDQDYFVIFTKNTHMWIQNFSVVSLHAVQFVAHCSLHALM